MLETIAIGSCISILALLISVEAYLHFLHERFSYQNHGNIVLKVCVLLKYTHFENLKRNGSFF
jgi:hypothetical protein